MKKIIHNWLYKICAQMLTLLGFGAVTGLNSCSFPVLYGPPPADYDLTITPTYLGLPCEGGSSTIQIKTNDRWIISKETDFVELSTTEGQGSSYVYVTINENTNSQSRETYLIICGVIGKERQEVIICQEGAYSNY